MPAMYYPMALDTAIRNFPAGGLMLEFGVFYGGTWIWSMERFKGIGVEDRWTMIGFDSWQGLPAETEGVWAPDRHAEGQFSTPKQTVLAKMQETFGHGEDGHHRFVDGFFEDTLTPELQASLGKVAFINVDVDIHKSTEELLEFCHPLMQNGTVIWFDDWKDPVDKHDQPWGEHLAWAQFLQRHPDIKVMQETADPQYNQRFMVLRCES